VTEEELTPLAKDIHNRMVGPLYGRQLACGYLALLAERDALKAQLAKVRCTCDVEMTHEFDCPFYRNEARP
jgi:hypothetical protein